MNPNYGIVSDTLLKPLELLELLEIMPPASWSKAWLLLTVRWECLAAPDCEMGEGVTCSLNPWNSQNSCPQASVSRVEEHRGRSLAEEHRGLSRVSLPSWRLVKARLTKTGLVKTCEGEG